MSSNGFSGKPKTTNCHNPILEHYPGVVKGFFKFFLLKAGFFEDYLRIVAKELIFFFLRRTILL